MKINESLVLGLVIPTKIEVCKIFVWMFMEYVRIRVRIYHHKNVGSYQIGCGFNAIFDEIVAIDVITKFIKLVFM